MAGSRYHEGKSGGEGEKFILIMKPFLRRPLTSLKQSEMSERDFFKRRIFRRSPLDEFSRKNSLRWRLFSSLARDTMTHRLRTLYARYAEREQFASFHCTACTHTMFSRKEEIRVDSICSSSLLRRSRPSNSIVFEEIIFSWEFFILFFCGGNRIRAENLTFPPPPSYFQRMLLAFFPILSFLFFKATVVGSLSFLSHVVDKTGGGVMPIRWIEIRHFLALAYLKYFLKTLFNTLLHEPNCFIFKYLQTIGEFLPFLEWAAAETKNCETHT